MVSARPGRRIMTLLSMACDGAGPSFTCMQIANGMHLGGSRTEVFATRRRIPSPRFRLVTSLPRALSMLPYDWVSAPAKSMIERRFLDEVREDDIAFVWPAVPLQVQKELKARGVTVVMEGINTRMASARRILDAAYDAFGIPPAHGITDARIAEEEEKYHYADAIFAPNRFVEAAQAGSPLEGRVMATSYGVDASKASPERSYKPDGAALTFVFCGHACVRKGVHHLLEAWKRLGGQHKLQFVGTIEPAIADRYRDILASDRVEKVGFVKDVHRYFAKADGFVMPSLEEGGPQVTYEAALHGLPILASPMGSCRIGDSEGAMLVVDPARTDEMAAALTRLIDSAELRATLGREARRRAFGFNWADVGARRGRMLQDRFG